MHLFILSRSAAALLPHLSSLLKNYSQAFCHHLTLYAFNSLLQRSLLLSSVVRNIHFDSPSRAVLNSVCAHVQLCHVRFVNVTLLHD